MRRKIFIVELLPKNVKKISEDGFSHKVLYDHTIKPVESLYKNKYYTGKERVDLRRDYIWKYYKSETKNSKNFIIDLVIDGNKEDQLGLKKYLAKNIINVLLYTNLNNLIKNFNKRKNYDIKDERVFSHFSNLYTYTDDPSEAIDAICLKDFIKNLKKIKYLFENEKDLIKLAERTFKRLKIKKLQLNKKYNIKPNYKYDIVLNSKNKTSKELVKELVNKVKNFEE